MKSKSFDQINKERESAKERDGKQERKQERK